MEQIVLKKSRYIKFLEFMNKVSTLFIQLHDGKLVNFAITIVIVLIINIIAIVGLLFSNYVNLEMSAKTSLISLLISLSFSYLTTKYNRIRDYIHEADRIKINECNNLFEMIYDNKDKLNNQLPLYIIINGEYEKFKKFPNYTKYTDIKHSYVVVLLPFLLNHYLNRIIELSKKYNEIRTKVSLEVTDYINSYLSSINPDYYTFRNIGDIIISKIYSNDSFTIEVFNRNSNFDAFNCIDIKPDYEYLRNAIKQKQSFVDLITIYNSVLDYNDRAYYYLLNKITNYFCV